jgi:hypothetical protein
MNDIWKWGWSMDYLQCIKLGAISEPRENMSISERTTVSAKTSDSSWTTHLLWEKWHLKQKPTIPASENLDRRQIYRNTRQVCCFFTDLCTDFLEIKECAPAWRARYVLLHRLNTCRRMSLFYGEMPLHMTTRRHTRKF